VLDIFTANPPEIFCESFSVFLLVAEVEVLIFQQDGAPAHFGAIICTALDKQFPDQWISRGGSINWPSQSADLTPMDFFWGYIKDIVHSERLVSFSHLC
jgi:hypothetical protein